MKNIPEQDRDLAKLDPAHGSMGTDGGEARKAWLAGLKDGDPVSIRKRCFFDRELAWSVFVIMRTTKTQFVLARWGSPDVEVYRVNRDTGLLRGNTRDRIDPYCDGVKYHNARASLLRKLERADFASLSYDNLSAIAHILEGTNE